MCGKLERFARESEDDWEVLVTACIQGDRLACERLLATARALALDVAQRQYHLRPDDAEDLAQLVQIRVSERLSQLRRPAAFRQWVRRIIDHLALDMLRQRPSPLSLDDPRSWTEMLLVQPESTEPYDRALLRADLERALARLPAHYQEPIRLHLLHDLPQELIAQLLKRPRSTIATQIERGLARLRRSLPGFMVLSY
jgi:RNA polymerase sigma-70 factor (ECF subfamily)